MNARTSRCRAVSISGIPALLGRCERVSDTEPVHPDLRRDPLRQLQSGIEVEPEAEQPLVTYLGRDRFVVAFAVGVVAPTIAFNCPTATASVLHGDREVHPFRLIQRQT